MVLAAASLVAGSPLVAANSEPMFSEMVWISVDCNNASVGIGLTAGSENDTLFHFPSPVNLNDTCLDDATSVAVMSSSDSSMIMYTFEGISESQAETNAEAELNTAFCITCNAYADGSIVCENAQIGYDQ